MWISNINKSITGSKHKIIRQLNFGSNFNYNLVDPQILALLVLAITGQQQGGTNNGMLNSNMWTFNAAPTGDDENGGGGGGNTATSDSNNELNPLDLLDEANAILESSQQTKFKGHVSDATKALFKTNTEEPAGTFTSLKGLREAKKKAKEDLEEKLNLYDGARNDVTTARNALKSAVDSGVDADILSASSALSDANTAASNAETALNEAGLASADAKKELKQGRMATAGAALSMAGDVINAVAPNRPEYEGPKGLITLTMDKAYDAIADGLSAIPVWGLLAGGIMKAGAGLGKVVGAIGGGTSGMTTTDAIMGSSFMNLTPWGLVNGFGGKTTDTFTKDEDAFAQVGSSYTGTNALADEALEHANKKYGLYSRGAMHEANALIAEAKRQQNIVSNISDTSQKRNNLRSSMSAIHSTNRTVRRSGGYNLSAMRSGRKGLRISSGMAGRIARVPILLLLGGGIHYQDQDYIDRLVQYAIDQNPLFIQRLLSTPTLYVITPTGQPGTHLLSSSNVDGYEIVYPMIQGRDGELLLIADNEDALNRALQSGDYIKFNSVEDANLFTKHYKEYFPEFMEAFSKLVAPYVDEEGRIDQEKVKSTKKEKEVTKHKLGGILQLGLAILLVSPFGEEVQTYKDGGSLTNLRIIQLVNPISENIESMQEGGEVADMPDLQLTLIELIDPTLGGDDIVPEEQEGIPLPAPIQPDIPTMREGGEINIIPDGALHKELHHMEDPEGEWTRKGIPVVDAEGNQVAEIENSEIIVRKELIESMEEFTKKYYAKEATKEEKEQLALDAGITLVNEILYNTVDKTNKLL